MRAVRALVLCAMLLAGCSHAAWQVGAGSVQAGAASATVSAGSGVAAFFGLVIIAGSAYEASRGGFDSLYGDSQRVPEMAPDRRIHEVDCSKPFDPSLGNIRCK